MAEEQRLGGTNRVTATAEEFGLRSDEMRTKLAGLFERFHWNPDPPREAKTK